MHCTWRNFLRLELFEKCIKVIDDKKEELNSDDSPLEGRKYS